MEYGSKEYGRRNMEEGIWKREFVKRKMGKVSIR
jgi:hypothetical protein